jgi:hypothetical protein
MKMLLPKPGDCFLGDNELAHGDRNRHIILPISARGAYFFRHNSTLSKPKPLHGYAAKHAEGATPTAGSALVGVELPKLIGILLIKCGAPITQCSVTTAQPLRASAHCFSACAKILSSTLLCPLTGV